VKSAAGEAAVGNGAEEAKQEYVIVKTLGPTMIDDPTT
jgi:hypothetical protein